MLIQKISVVPSSNRIQLQVEQGQQSHLPPGGLRGKIHGHLHEVCGGDLWRILIRTHSFFGYQTRLLKEHLSQDKHSKEN